MKTKSRKSVFLTSGIAALALLLCAACKPPLDPIIEVAVDNRVAFSTTVAPLTFVDPARLLTGGGGVQSAVFELTEARTGEVSVYNDPECAVEAGLWAVVQGRRLTVAAGEGDIPEETPFYAVITEGGRASAPSAFALTRQERFEVPRTITWADVQDQINAGRPVVDLLNRRWDADLVFDRTIYQTRTLTNGGVRFIKMDMRFVTLSRVSADEVEITNGAEQLIMSRCTIGTVRDLWRNDGYDPPLFNNCTIGTLYYYNDYDYCAPTLVNCTVGQENILE